jgi:hypothetical protein
LGKDRIGLCQFCLCCRKKVAEDERLQELTARVEERRAAVRDLRQALTAARAHNAELEAATEEVCCV